MAGESALGLPPTVLTRLLEGLRGSALVPHDEINFAENIVAFTPDQWNELLRQASF